MSGANGFIQPVEVVVGGDLPRAGFVQPVEIVGGPGSGITGSGTAGHVAIFTAPTVIGSSGVGIIDGLQMPDGTALGVSPVGSGRIRYNNTTKTFQASVDGGAYGSLAGGGMAIGGTVTGGTAGRILFVAAGPVLAQDAGLTYDAAAKKVTITGAGGPQQRWAFDGSNYVEAECDLTGDIYFRPTGGSLYVQANLQGADLFVDSDDDESSIIYLSSDESPNWSFEKTATTHDLFIANESDTVILGHQSDGSVGFGSSAESMYWDQTGLNLVAGAGLTSVRAAYLNADHMALFGSTVAGEGGQVGIVGNQTTDVAIGIINFHNAAIPGAEKRLFSFNVDRFGANNTGLLTTVIWNAGVQVFPYKLTPTEMVVNYGNGDYDFRIAGDTDPNLLVVDASTDTVKVSNLGIGQAVAGATILGVSGTETIASAAGALWDGISYITAAAVLTGNTNITTAAGFNYFNINQPTITSASAITITAAATFTIKGQPIGGGAGPTTITSSYAMWIQSGDARIDGRVIGAAGTAGAPTFNFITNQTSGMYQRTSGSINFSISGNAHTEIQSARFIIGQSANLTFLSGAPGVGSIIGELTPSNGGFNLVCTGTGASVGLVDSNTIQLKLGADNNSTARTNNTLKVSRLSGYHYTNAEEEMTIIWGISSTSANDVIIGGGTSANNAATSFAVYFAANNTTVTGTEYLHATAAEWVHNDGQLDHDFRIEGDSISHLFFTDATSTTENIAMLAAAAPNWQTMDRGIFIGDTQNAPNANPTAGGFLYSNAGALTWRGSGGTVTPIGPAGPHCEDCGMDFWSVAALNPAWRAWCYVCGYCGAEYKGGPQSVLGRLDSQQRKEVIRKGMRWEEISKAMRVAA